MGRAPCEEESRGGSPGSLGDVREKSVVSAFPSFAYRCAIRSRQVRRRAFSTAPSSPATSPPRAGRRRPRPTPAPGRTPCPRTDLARFARSNDCRSRCGPDATVGLRPRNFPPQTRRAPTRQNVQIAHGSARRGRPCTEALLRRPGSREFTGGSRTGGSRSIRGQRVVRPSGGQL